MSELNHIHIRRDLVFFFYNKKNYNLFNGVAYGELQEYSKALFARRVLEGKGEERKTYGEVNPCVRVLKK